MSQDQNQEIDKALEPARTDGMNPKEVDSLRRYIDNGMPGVTSVRDDQVETMFKLYMEGSTYSEISMKTFVKKDIILFLSYKYSWPSRRQERMGNLIESLDSKIGIIRLESSEFIVDVARFIHSYIRDRMQIYDKTKDPGVLDATDWKLLNHYYKCVEVMKGSANTSPASPSLGTQQSPNVSIYAADGSTVNLGKETDNPSVDHSSILKFFADLERAKEQQQQKEKNRKDK